MSIEDLHLRFEELEAGRILGDLSPEEMIEWKELSEAHGFNPDGSLELTAAAIETEFLLSQTQPLPANVAEALRQAIPQFASRKPPIPAIIVIPVWKRIVRSPQTPWSIAAAFALLFAINTISDAPDVGLSGNAVDRPAALSPKEARDQLLGKARDLIESEFGGTENYRQISGKVVWSDELQEGYMTLSDLPVNDPNKNQYQLWIVDPARDEKPVDGGVFDIPEGQSAAVVAIRNPLLIKKPQAFVITLEQPGGVVVSKQEVVVALAKTS
jgi:hypothetical protein